jgi:diguanylate cyclase (GGDEF)-like protein/PAS domain S-box-containing protein
MAGEGGPNHQMTGPGATTEDRLRSSDRLLNAVGQAVVAWNLDGEVTYLNAAAEAMYGWPREVGVGSQAMDLSGARLSADQLENIASTLNEGRSWSGEITVGRADGTVAPAWVTNTPVVEDGEIVGFIGVSLDISERKAAEATSWHRATHDALTDLANHRSLTDQIDEELVRLDHGCALTAILVDLGPLDVVNDNFGHGAGQALIQRAAEVLATIVHEGDLLARFSGRTFAVTCGHGLADADAFAYADAMRAALADPEALGRPDVHLRVSAAVAAVTPPATGAEDLLRCATTALSVARATEATRTYDDSMRADLARRLQVEALVERTILSGRVALGYQPIVRLRDEVTIGGEALLRLVDDQGDPVPAIEVVAAAERIGKIGELGGIVLRQACSDVASWQHAAPDRAMTISVNISALQLDDPSLPERVTEAVRDAGIDASTLWLEITEGAMMRDPRRCGMVLADLRARGIRLSADDFGTGYSSLAYLRRFPLDSIKIDQSFVAGLPQNLEDHAIVQAILAMADALGLRVVAEGVERDSQLEDLRSLGTAYGQGFLWSPAIPSLAFLARLESEAAAEPALAGSTPAPARLALISGATAEERTDAAIAVLAHEIRQPLTVITGYSGLLERMPDCDTVKMGTAISRAAHRIGRILAHVVEESAEGATALDLELTEVDAVALAGRMVRELSRTIDNPLALVADEAAPLVVRIDVDQIEQVLVNLVGNAVKFSPPGSPIQVTVHADDDFVDLSVLDEGEGIAPDELALVFRKYGRAEGTAAGTGMGLFLARHIARHHGGDILFRLRDDGPGSAVVLRLPRPLEVPPPDAPGDRDGSVSPLGAS